MTRKKHVRVSVVPVPARESVAKTEPARGGAAIAPLPKHLHRHATTLVELLVRRGCVMDPGPFRVRMTGTCLRRGRFTIHFYNTDEAVSIGKQLIVDDIVAARQNGFRHVIFCVANIVTPKGTEARHEALTGDEPVTTEVFSYSELHQDVTRHILVPLHEWVSDPDECRALVSRLCPQQKLRSASMIALGGPSSAMSVDHPCSATTCFHLPRLLSSDRMARQINVQAGDLVKITADSSTAVQTVKYRVCVAADETH